jgi:hypothetical protein
MANFGLERTLRQERKKEREREEEESSRILHVYQTTRSELWTRKRVLWDYKRARKINPTLLTTLDRIY